MYVLVVGASGVLGRETVRRLRAQGHRVRGMTRRPEPARELEGLGAEPVQGDLTDPASLARACAGVERVLAAAHGLLGKDRNDSAAIDDAGHRALIDAARNAGVARFVYTSAHGAAADHPIEFLRTKWALEQYLARSGMDYAILRPTAFMEWHAHEFNGKALLAKGRTVVLGRGTKPRNFVAARDVAAFAVKCLTEDALPERILTIGGPGNFTNDEVTALYAAAAGIAPRATHLSPRLLSILARVITPLHAGIGRVMTLSALPDDAFSETFDAAALVRDYDVALTPLEAFVRERVDERRAASPR